MPTDWEEEVATVKIVVVGGGAAGIGAAGAAKGTDKNADVVVYTEYEDAAYSPCGIPYVHGKEIADFQSLFLATKESYKESGIDIHYETAVTGLDVGKRTVTVGGDGPADGAGKLREVRTDQGELPADLVMVCTQKRPNTTLAAGAGLKIGSTGGIVVDARMATSASGIFAAGDCIEIPHGVSNVPIQGLSGSHAYAQGKVAGTNAAGGKRAYQPVYVPWGMVAGKWMIGGVSFGETLATALGVPYVLGQATGISRARYYPGVKKVKVKLLAEPGPLRLIGAQMVGQEGIKERADFLAMCVKTGITLEDLAYMENVYSPPIGALNEPIAVAAQNGLAAVAAAAAAKAKV